MNPAQLAALAKAKSDNKKVNPRHFAWFLPVSKLTGQHGNSRQKKKQTGS
jgi:hypothetical protein